MVTKDIPTLAEDLGRCLERERWVERLTRLIVTPGTPAEVKLALLELLAERDKVD